MCRRAYRHRRGASVSTLCRFILHACAVKVPAYSAFCFCRCALFAQLVISFSSTFVHRCRVLFPITIGFSLGCVNKIRYLFLGRELNFVSYPIRPVQEDIYRDWPQFKRRSNKFLTQMARSIPPFETVYCVTAETGEMPARACKRC